jgi:hypothetical protein
LPKINNIVRFVGNHLNFISSFLLFPRAPLFISIVHLSVVPPFRYWLGFWYGDESFTLEETKEVFFLTLKKLLDDEQVILSPLG